jgi:cell division protein FtsB
MYLIKSFVLENLDFDEKQTIKKNFKDNSKKIDVCIHILNEVDFLFENFLKCYKSNSKKIYFDYDEFKKELNNDIDNIEKEITSQCENKKTFDLFYKINNFEKGIWYLIILFEVEFLSQKKCVNDYDTNDDYNIFEDVSSYDLKDMILDLKKENENLKNENENLKKENEDLKYNNNIGTIKSRLIN